IRIVSGPPRIAPLLDDLNPGASGLITVEYIPSQGPRQPDFMVFTWRNVGEWATGGTASGSNTFQVTLRSDSVFDFRYSGIQAAQAVVGAGPGDGADSHIDLIDYSSWNSPAIMTGVIAEVFSTSQQIDLTAVG